MGNGDVGGLSAELKKGGFDWGGLGNGEVGEWFFSFPRKGWFGARCFGEGVASHLASTRKPGVDQPNDLEDGVVDGLEPGGLELSSGALQIHTTRGRLDQTSNFTFFFSEQLR